MNAADLALIGKLKRLNSSLGEVLLELLRNEVNTELPAAGLRALAEGLSVMARDLVARADEIEKVIDEGPAT